MPAATLTYCSFVPRNLTKLPRKLIVRTHHLWVYMFMKSGSNLRFNSSDASMNGHFLGTTQTWPDSIPVTNAITPAFPYQRSRKYLLLIVLILYWNLDNAKKIRFQRSVDRVVRFPQLCLLMLMTPTTNHECAQQKSLHSLHDINANRMTRWTCLQAWAHSNHAAALLNSLFYSIYHIACWLDRVTISMLHLEFGKFESMPKKPIDNSIWI